MSSSAAIDLASLNGHRRLERIPEATGSWRISRDQACVYMGSLGRERLLGHPERLLLYMGVLPPSGSTGNCGSI
jgi:hypothetical protein